MAEQTTAMSGLDAIRAAGTSVIADTADFANISRFKPDEGTTNPTLLLTASRLPEYASFTERTHSHLSTIPEPADDRLLQGLEYMAVLFGTEICRLTGRVSTEVDVRLSFDTAKTIKSALRIIDLYAEQGVPRERVRIKIAATWEGTEAAKVLERDHQISVLITIVFGLAQVAAAAAAGVTAIAPYVGRIDDWHKANGITMESGDAGVGRVREMQRYLHARGSKTKIMAASFRNIHQCLDLSGIDLMTISPNVLSGLGADFTSRPDASSAQRSAATINIKCDTEASFRWHFNNDACAVEKTAEAIRRFAADTVELENSLLL